MAGHRSLDGEPDSIARWNVVIEPYELSDNAHLYSVIGHSGDISAVVRVVYDGDTASANEVEVFYTAPSGLELKSVHLESFLKTRSKPDGILSADDKDMYDYLCNSY